MLRFDGKNCWKLSWGENVNYKRLFPEDEKVYTILKNGVVVGVADEDLNVCELIEGEEGNILDFLFHSHGRNSIRARLRSESIKKEKRCAKRSSRRIEDRKSRFDN